MPTRHEAQQRVDQIRAFQNELERLHAEGGLALSPEQDHGLRAHHAGLLARLARDFDTDRTTGSKQLSLGMHVASMLGALSLAASVYFLFHAFWGLLPTPVQLTILTTAPLLSLGLTALISARDATGYFTRLAAMTAFACFVLNLTLVGQIFNLPRSPNALVPWAVFALLLAYYSESRLLLAVAILSGLAWIGAPDNFDWFDPFDWFDLKGPLERYFPAAALLVTVPAIARHGRCADFSPVYRVLGLLAAYLPILVLGLFGDNSLLPWSSKTIEGFYEVAGFVLAIASAGLGIRFRHAHVANAAVTFFIVLLGLKFFEWWWHVVPRYVFFLILSLMAVLFLLILRRLRGVIVARLEGASS